MKKQTPTYISWKSMKSRCLNPKAANYPAYGGRGITVCESWMVFSNFLKDMGERPDGTSLDRIDNTKGYCKENCRWVSFLEQGANKKNNLLITYQGVTKTAAQWSLDLGLAKSAVWQRIKKYGWSPEKAVSVARTRAL